MLNLFIVGIVCLFVGAVIGLFVAALCNAARHGEDQGVVDLGEWKPSRAPIDGRHNQISPERQLLERQLGL